MNSLALFLTIFSFIFSHVTLAAQDGETIDGTWVEVTQGCELDLSESEIRNLPRRGADSFYFTTLLSLNNGKYSSSHTKGTGCKEGYSVQHALEGHRIPLHCGKRLLTEGTYSQQTFSGIYLFEGSPIEQDGTVYDAFGVDYKQVILRSLGEVLVTEQRGTLQCHLDRLVRYWIPFPAS